MEFIIIDGERVAIPAEIVSAGRAEVEAWIAARAAGHIPPAVELPVSDATSVAP